MMDGVKCFHEVNENHLQRLMLLAALFLKLASREDHISGTLRWSESALQFWEDFLGQGEQPVEENSRKNLSRGGQQGDSSIISTT